MKKTIMCLSVLLIFFCSGSVFGGEFENNLKKAEQGDAIAQSLVGYAYGIGKGVSQED